MGTEAVMMMMCEPFTVNCENCLLNLTSLRIVLMTVSGEDSSDLLKMTTFASIAIPTGFTFSDHDRGVVQRDFARLKREHKGTSWVPCC